MITDGVVVSAALAAAAELALSPSAEKRDARRRNQTPPPNPPATLSAEVAVPGDGDVSRLATRMAADLGDALVAFAAANAYPLARAALPGDAIRAAVALFLGQRDALRAAGKALLAAQALGPGYVAESFPATGANVQEVWTRVCGFPESRRAALEGALLAARAAAGGGGPRRPARGAAQVSLHARHLLVAAEAADRREADESRTLLATASRAAVSASRACASLRVAFAEATFELVAATAGEAADRAAETWAQGDLIKTFRALPGAFATWSKRHRNSSALSDADSTEPNENASSSLKTKTAGDRSLALWWVPGCLRLCARAARPPSPDTGSSLWTRRSPRASPTASSSPSPTSPPRLRRRRGARSPRWRRDETATRRTRPPSRPSARFWRGTSRAKRPNLGVGLLESLPSRSLAAASKPAKPVFVSDDVERAEALYESRRKKPSLRERLATSALAPTAAERDGDGRGGGGGGFAADPLDSWNADRGGFASYPADADEPDVGDAIVVDDDEDDDDGFDFLDCFGDSPPAARARGLGPAVADRLRAQSPYERNLARARADAGSSVNRRGGRGGARPSPTDADILADVHAGGPTHKPKKTSSSSAFAGRRDFGHASGAFAGAAVAAVREASAAKEGMIRERAELANKRERERAEAKAAREKRLAEKHWERENVIALDGAGDAPRNAAEVVTLAPAAAAASARGFGGGTGPRSNFQAPNWFGGLRGRLLGPGLRNANAALLRSGRFDASPEPPWVVPECDDLVAVALRWSASHALRAADRAATEDDDARFFRGQKNDANANASSSPPSTFPSGRAYVEHFAPLLLAELRAQIGSSMEEAGGVAPGIPTPGVVESVAAKTRERSAFHVARVALGRSREGAASSFQENDLVLLEKKNACHASSTEGLPFVDVASRAHSSRRTTQRYHAFGVVEGVETGSASKSWSGASVGGKSSAEENDSRVLLKIRVCLVEDALSPTTRWLTGSGGGP